MSLDGYWYDKLGNPISVRGWERLQEDPAYKVVAQHQVGDAWVSTVWLGLDHRFGEGPPLIFETMVFGGRLSDELERYSTEAQAWEGHAVMVGRVREVQGEPVEVTEHRYYDDPGP